MESNTLRIVKSDYPLDYKHSIKVKNADGRDIYLTFQQLQPENNESPYSMSNQWMNVPLIEEWERYGH